MSGSPSQVRQIVRDEIRVMEQNTQRASSMKSNNENPVFNWTEIRAAMDAELQVNGFAESAEKWEIYKAGRMGYSSTGMEKSVWHPAKGPVMISIPKIEINAFLAAGGTVQAYAEQRVSAALAAIDRYADENDGWRESVLAKDKPAGYSVPDSESL